MNLSSSYAYSPTDAQVLPLTVSTDKREYSEGDIIIISGVVKSPVAKSQLTLQIFDSQLNLVHVEQTDLSKDGTYTIAVKIGGDLWKNFGTYKIRAQYGFNHVVAQTNFDFVELVKPTKQTFHLDVNNQGYDIPYVINGGAVNDMQVDFPSLALTLSINATKNGAVSLDIPRDFMDAKKMDGSDERFIVLINGTEVDPSEAQVSSLSRNVTVNFLKEDSQIELIGTQIVPEFPLAMPILLIGFVTLLVFYRVKVSSALA
ncbi:MAG: PEFG-CTERM sorting domain-containing protein [Nitrosotalea sp.]